jgi:hypothetical protein
MSGRNMDNEGKDILTQFEHAVDNGSLFEGAMSIPGSFESLHIGTNSEPSVTIVLLKCE